MFFIQNDPVLLLSLQCTNYLTKRFIFTRVFEVRFNVTLSNIEEKDIRYLWLQVIL